MSVKTAILKLGGLGDLLMATPAIRAFKKSFPDSHLCFLVGQSNVGVLKNNLYIDELVAVDDRAILVGTITEKAREAYRLLRVIQDRGCTEVFILHRDWRYNLVSFLSRVRHRYGFARDLRGMFLTRSVITTDKRHEIEKYIALFSLKEGFQPDGTKMDIFPSNDDLYAAEILLEQARGRQPLVALAPGGASNVKEEMEIRRWPIEYYIKLVGLLLDAGVNILLIGGKSDLRFAEQIKTRYSAYSNGRIVDVIGKLSIQGTYSAIQKSAVMVAHDSGPMHIGAAAGIPVVSIFGPTSPEEKKPLSNRLDYSFWVGDSLPCAPCYKDGHFPLCSSRTCMYSVTPDIVIDQVQAILTSQGF